MSELPEGMGRVTVRADKDGYTIVTVHHRVTVETAAAIVKLVNSAQADEATAMMVEQLILESSPPAPSKSATILKLVKDEDEKL